MQRAWNIIRTSLDDYLRSSTIHGLAHISTATSCFSKLSWLLVVIIACTIGGFLVYDSWSEWELTPTVSSIETIPISEIAFPEVTVCAPRRSNTALNYDLLAAENKTIDASAVKELRRIAEKLAHKLYHNKCIACLLYTSDAADE